MSYKAASGVKTRERKAISRNFTTIFIGVFLAGNGNKRIGKKNEKKKRKTNKKKPKKIKQKKQQKTNK